MIIINGMSYLDNSVSSEQESPTRATRHSLCQDLQEVELRSETKSQESGNFGIEVEDEGNNSYILPNYKNKLENQPQLQQNSKLAQPEAQNNLDQKIDEGQDSSSPKTITLIDEDIISKDSINMSSKISQYSLEVDNQSFATFLSIRDNSYATAIKNFQVLFENVYNLFSDRLKNISDTYLAFLKIKYTQQKSYESVNLCHPQNSRNHIIYMDCKTLSDQIHNKITSQKQRHVIYLKSIQNFKTKLEKTINESTNSMQTKHNKIADLLKKLTATVNEMNDLMIPQHRKKNKKAINPEIYQCSFIRTKYLMSQERVYLNYISAYLQNVLSFVGYVCLELEAKNCLAVKECMLGYAEALALFEPQCSSQLQNGAKMLNKINCYQQTYDEVSKLLELCIPEPIKPHQSASSSTQSGQKKLKRLIQGLISQSQSLVYIPVIELENKDYAYHSKNKADVKWVKVNHQRKYKEETIEEHDTYVIVTHDGNLVLELIDDDDKRQEKMAILKLKNLKLSRKNNKVFLTDKGSGMLGYLFSSDSVLGSLIFEPLHNSNDPLASQTSIIDNFIQKVKGVVEEKKNKEKLAPT